MNITVRPIEARDKLSWKELYFAYLKFYESETDDSSTELLWNRLTRPEPDIQGLVAELDGPVVGIAHFHYQISTWTNNYNCYLEDLYVSEVERGNGVATALIAEVKDLAVNQKCAELFWITKKSNYVARKLYDKVAAESDFVRYEIILEK